MDASHIPSPPTSSAIVMGTPHVEVTAALELLAVVLAEADAHLVDDDLADGVADVVSCLVDVRPPLPPLTYPYRGAADDAHAVALIRRAATRLRIAVFASPDHAEKLRAAIAVRHLHSLIERRQP